MTGELITPEEIAIAAARLRSRVLRTPLVPLSDGDVLLKAENLHRSGSFKIRGAYNSILALSAQERSRGVVAHSSGNHAIAVALVGRDLDVPVTIVMPEDAPTVKVERTRSLGARVELVGVASEARKDRAAELCRARGSTLVEPYNSRAVIAATATIAVEVLEDLDGRGAPAIYVPISGGGLAAGVAAGAKLMRPDVRVVGVEPEVAATASASRQAGRLVSLPAERMSRTMADGLRVQRIGDLAWPHLEAFVDDVVTVSEPEIVEAMRSVLLGSRLLAEPSGAVSVAAAVRGRGLARPTASVVAILTGGNVDPATIVTALDGGLPSRREP